MNKLKQLIYFILFTIILLIILNIIHELGHILLQLIYKVPINLFIKNWGFHTAKLEDLLKLSRYRFIALYSMGFIFSLIPLFIKKTREFILKYSIIKKPILIYLIYILISLFLALLDIKNLFIII